MRSFAIDRSYVWNTCVIKHQLLKRSREEETSHQMIRQSVVSALPFRPEVSDLLTLFVTSYGIRGQYGETQIRCFWKHVSVLSCGKQNNATPAPST
jgi:hypothetical protein